MHLYFLAIALESLFADAGDVGQHCLDPGVAFLRFFTHAEAGDFGRICLGQCLDLFIALLGLLRDRLEGFFHFIAPRFLLGDHLLLQIVRQLALIPLEHGLA